MRRARLGLGAKASGLLSPLSRSHDAELCAQLRYRQPARTAAATRSPRALAARARCTPAFISTTATRTTTPREQLVRLTSASSKLSEDQQAQRYSPSTASPPWTSAPSPHLPPTSRPSPSAASPALSHHQPTTARPDPPLGRANPPRASALGGTRRSRAQEEPEPARPSSPSSATLGSTRRRHWEERRRACGAGAQARARAKLLARRAGAVRPPLPLSMLWLRL